MRNIDLVLTKMSSITMAHKEEHCRFSKENFCRTIPWQGQLSLQFVGDQSSCYIITGPIIFDLPCCHTHYSSINRGALQWLDEHLLAIPGNNSIRTHHRKK